MSVHDPSVGIDHPTIVPTNFDPDEWSPETDTGGSPSEEVVEEVVER